MLDRFDVKLRGKNGNSKYLKIRARRDIDITLENHLRKEVGCGKPFKMCQMSDRFDVKLCEGKMVIQSIWKI